MARNYTTWYHRMRAMSLPEIGYRLHHNVRSRLQRLQLPPSGTVIPPEQFLVRQGVIEPSRTIPEQLADLVVDFRRRAVFAWQKDEWDQLVGFYRAVWPDEESSLLQSANDFCRRRFSIFSQPVAFKNEIDWHYDPVAQKSVPVRYWTQIPYWQADVAPGVKYIWELNRHQHFVTLAQAYALSGDRRFAVELFSQWQHWLQANPYGWGINWCSSLEAGLRLISWTWALQFAKPSSYLTPLFYCHLLQSVEQHADFIAGHLSRYSSANNHLLGEAVGLIYAGSYFQPLRRAAEWREVGFSVFFAEFLRQVHPDGVSREQSTQYQLYVFYYGLLALLAADHTGRPVAQEFRERLAKMAEFVFSLLDESGELPGIGDEDGGQVLQVSKSGPSALRMLSTAAVAFERNDLKPGALHPEVLWLVGLERTLAWQNKPSAAVQRKSVFYPDGGYVILHRTVNGCRQRLIFDAGPLGLDRMAAHGHADALSLVLSAAGRPVLIDSGTFSYRCGPGWRDYFRSTRAHNTIEIDGQSQSEIVGPFQWGHKAHARFTDVQLAQEPLLITAEQDGYRRLDVLHERRLEQRGARWLVTDTLHGRDKHQVLLTWHLAPGTTQRLSGDKFLWTCADLSMTLAVRASAVFDSRIQQGALAPIQGWHSADYGVKNSNPVLCITLFNRLPLEIITEIEIGLR
ncbi:hypothetical protein GX408_13210 [bacterium]|nr:hypothetical protein [bacterium]